MSHAPLRQMPSPLSREASQEELRPTSRERPTSKDRPTSKESQRSGSSSKKKSKKKSGESAKKGSKDSKPSKGSKSSKSSQNSSRSRDSKHASHEEGDQIGTGESILVSFDINAPPEGLEEDEFFDIPEGATAARLADLKAELSKPHSALRLRIKDRLERTIGVDAAKIYDVPDVALPAPKIKYKMSFTVQDELSLRELPKNTGNAYFMKGFDSRTAPFTGVRPDLLPVISQRQVSIDKSMLPALYQPFREERKHPYGLEDPSTLCPRGTFKQPPETTEPLFSLVQQEVPPPDATIVPRTFGRKKP